MKRLYCFAIRMYYRVWKATEVSGHTWTGPDNDIHCEFCGTKRK